MTSSTQYDHLATDIAATRYAMAGHFLSGCDVVMEIGGSRHCAIDHFLTEKDGILPDVMVVGNDVPNVEFWDTKVRYFNSDIEDFHLSTYMSQYNSGLRGLCIMGLELFPKRTDSDPLAVIIGGLSFFDRVVIDYVTTNARASSQFLMLMGAMGSLGMSMSIDLMSEWKYDRKYFVTKEAQGEEPTLSFYKERRFMVFDK